MKPSVSAAAREAAIVERVALGTAPEAREEVELTRGSPDRIATWLLVRKSLDGVAATVLVRDEAPPREATREVRRSLSWSGRELPAERGAVVRGRPTLAEAEGVALVTAVGRPAADQGDAPLERPPTDVPFTEGTVKGGWRLAAGDWRLGAMERPPAGGVNDREGAGMERPAEGGLMDREGAGVERPAEGGLIDREGAGMERPVAGGLNDREGAGMERPAAGGLNEREGAGMERPDPACEKDREAGGGEKDRDDDGGEKDREGALEGREGAENDLEPPEEGAENDREPPEEREDDPMDPEEPEEREPPPELLPPPRDCASASPQLQKRSEVRERTLNHVPLWKKCCRLMPPPIVSSLFTAV